MWLIDLEPYEHCRVAGVVRRLRVDPTGGYIEATVNDGTGEVAARWPIRRSAPELAIVRGRRWLLTASQRWGTRAR